MKKMLAALLIGLIFLPTIAAAQEKYVGVGLVCKTYGETVAKAKDITVLDVLKEMIDKNAVIEGQPKCVEYGIYNPFDVKLESSLVFTGEIKDKIFTVEPSSVIVDPDKNKLPEEAIPVKVCFKVETKYPYAPVKYVGSTTAVWSMKPEEGGGTGSATGGSVECPFYLQVNTEAGQEQMLEQRKDAIFKLQVLVTLIIAVIVILVVLGIYKKKKKKEWEEKVIKVCPKCKKQYPLDLEHCPKCGTKLKKYKAGKEID